MAEQGRDEGAENSFTGRMLRYVRTSGTVGGLAVRVAGERLLGLRIDRDSHAADLMAALGGLKGPLMKVAQFLSTVPDALPPEYAGELAKLQSNAPPMGWPFVRRRMSSELGPDWQRRFARFGHEAVAAASLGQVHRAALPDGTEVACKLQYPDMGAVVEADLRQLKVIMAIYHRMDGAIDHEEIYKELSTRLREELDYRREAAQMRLYRRMLAPWAPDLLVPDPVPDYCTGRLLTMSWLEGAPLLPRLEQDPPQEERNRIAENLFHAWYGPLYGYGVIHGDPHLGNYQVRPEGGVNLLDFGCIRVFPPPFVQGVIELYHAVRDRDRERARHAYEIWGFAGISNEMMDVLNIWADFLYAPLLDDRVRRIQPTDDPNYGREVAFKVHQGLKRLGGVRPPREFVLMDRAAIGLGSVFIRLKAELNWHHLFHQLTDGFSADRLGQRQQEALAAAGVPQPT